MAYIDNKAIQLQGQKVRRLARAHVRAHMTLSHIHIPSLTQIIVSSLNWHCKLCCKPILSSDYTISSALVY